MHEGDRCMYVCDAIDAYDVIYTCDTIDAYDVIDTCDATDALMRSIHVI
jgi:hypothetical protein